jgi:alkaline phosphatase D
VLHLGDFIYEVVQYPDQVKDGKRYDRVIKFPIKFEHGKAVANNRFWVPGSLDDYRALYHAYLLDPDLQDARARFPFVAMWDNHEFSWLGWQSIQEFGEGPGFPRRRSRSRRTRPGSNTSRRASRRRARTLDTFDAPHVVDTPVTDFDDTAWAREPNNLAAIESLIAYRALRWGRHIDLIITDQRSFRSPTRQSRRAQPAVREHAFQLLSRALSMQLDSGRDFADGHPPAKLSFGDKSIANFRAGEPAQSMLGAKQKAWFLERLRGARRPGRSGAIRWARPIGASIRRTCRPRWASGPTATAVLANGDWGGTYHERAEIFDAVRDAGITGFAIVSGDRHSFWAGYAAKALPPAAFEPVGVTFVGGSISSPGMAEANEHNLKKDDPLRPLFVANPGDGPPQPTVNLLLHHGVRSALEYARSGDLAKAHAVRNPEMAPHLSFVDMGGHGYATVRVDASAMVTDFVCIPRPIERSPGVDGGPLRYRVRHEGAAVAAGRTAADAADGGGGRCGTGGVMIQALDLTHLDGSIALIMRLLRGISQACSCELVRLRDRRAPGKRQPNESQSVCTASEKLSAFVISRAPAMNTSAA